MMENPKEPKNPNPEELACRRFGSLVLQFSLLLPALYRRA
jgi:hypothetical protein